jgi:hypothetical protein
MAYAVAGTVLGSQSLRASVAPVVAFGASPARAAVVAIAVAAGACALPAGVVAAVVALIAHGVADPPRALDALASGYAGALGGAAYVTWFALGSAFGRRGGGRAALLVADAVLGAAPGASALVTPRGHLCNLLGGTPPVNLTERASACLLVALAVVFTAWAARRARSA